jgi:hypothetical protein
MGCLQIKMFNTLISALVIFILVGTFIQWGLTHAYPHAIM